MTSFATMGLWWTMASTAAAEPVALWALDESARVDPRSGLVIEGRGGLGWGAAAAYRSENPVFQEVSRTVSLVGSRNETVAFQVILDF